ncbi:MULTISPECIES: ATP-binding protein [Streptomyces]|uniref:ATP-binding protein n=1 Tax=Streptomyces TaxID=1883 RepID=UPI00287FC208|nr:ATP-binding protein [Streptomyces sp. CGMCC 4.1456]WNF67735.1 ATP-binding protein [Streptomyces sp. CGMCC 4.1456]
MDDAGLGMTQDERARAQRMVGSCEPILLTELGDPPRMGLAAIGQLTRQFDLSVDLSSPSPYGGVRAVLRIDRHLLTRIDPEELPPAASAPRSTRREAVRDTAGGSASPRGAEPGALSPSPGTEPARAAPSHGAQPAPAAVSDGSQEPDEPAPTAGSHGPAPTAGPERPEPAATAPDHEHGYGTDQEDRAGAPAPGHHSPGDSGGLPQRRRRSRAEEAEDEFCGECWTVTNGIPFEAVELAIRLRERRVRGTQDEVPVMRDLAAAVKGPGLIERLKRLGPSTVRFAWAGAVLGGPFSPESAADLAVVGSAEAVEATEKLRACRILTDADEAAGALEFVHPLIATTVYRDIPSGLRVGMHDAAANAAQTVESDPTAAARHLLEVPCDGRAETVACLRAAAREYLRAGAPEAARRVLTRALREPPPAEDRAALLHELAGSTFLIEPTATVSHLREALKEPGIDPDLRASIVYRLTQALAHTDRLTEAATVAADEARRATNARVRLRMQADHFVWSAFRADEPDSSARSRRLARLAGKLTGRGLEERYILGLRAWDALVRGEPRRSALEYAEEALSGGMSWTDENRGFEVPVAVALLFMYCDQPRRAEDLFAAGMAECEHRGWRGSHLAQGQTLLGYIRYRRGCLPEAEELVRAGLHTAERVEGAVPAQWFAIGILIQILLARGRTTDARLLADTYHYGDVVPNAVIFPDPRTVYAELLLAEGRFAEAASLLSRVGDWLESRDWHNPAWCPWQLGLASALARTAPDQAVLHAQDAAKRARDFGAASAIGQALRVQAEVTGGQAALELHTQAVDHLERSPAAYELARALVGHGAALVRSGRLHDAADRLYQGLEGAVHCGAEGLAARARRELSAAGLRPLPLRYAQTDMLTGPERRAAEKTAQGHPAPVVAQELRITEQGVRHLLSSVYRKLGTDTAGLADALENCPWPGR